MNVLFIFSLHQIQINLFKSSYITTDSAADYMNCFHHRPNISNGACDRFNAFVAVFDSELHGVIGEE